MGGLALDARSWAAGIAKAAAQQTLLPANNLMPNAHFWCDDWSMHWCDMKQHGFAKRHQLHWLLLLRACWLSGLHCWYQAELGAAPGCREIGDKKSDARSPPTLFLHGVPSQSYSFMPVRNIFHGMLHTTDTGSRREARIREAATGGQQPITQEGRSSLQRCRSRPLMCDGAMRRCCGNWNRKAGMPMHLIGQALASASTRSPSSASTTQNRSSTR